MERAERAAASRMDIRRDGACAIRGVRMLAQQHSVESAPALSSSLAHTDGPLLWVINGSVDAHSGGEEMQRRLGLGLLGAVGIDATLAQDLGELCRGLGNLVRIGFD